MRISDWSSDVCSSDLLMNALFRPAAQRLQPLSLEARIDRDPLTVHDADGTPRTHWIGHESTYAPPGASLSTLYWAPFWGARNEGEQVDAAQALNQIERASCRERGGQYE